MKMEEKKNKIIIKIDLNVCGVLNVGNNSIRINMWIFVEEIADNNNS